MRVLVACEFSGIVRDAFAGRGHKAVSCDLLPSETAGHHLVGDVVREISYSQNIWDIMIAFPPCTHLCASGARWFKEKKTEQESAIEFVRTLMDAPINRIAIENPIGILSTHIRKPDQIIQPWMFGHGETKATCLWLKGLPPLQPTHEEGKTLFWDEAPEERVARVHREPPSPDRWKNRSRTLPGIAKAMSEQWG